MFRELLDFLGDLDADTVTLTASRVYGVQVRVERTVQDDKVLTMTYLLSIAELVTVREPSLLLDDIKRKWTANKKDDTNWSEQ